MSRHRKSSRGAEQRLYNDISRQLARAATPLPGCHCPTLKECSARGCRCCREAIAAGRDPSDKACTIPGSPPCEG